MAFIMWYVDDNGAQRVVTPETRVERCDDPSCALEHDIIHSTNDHAPTQAERRALARQILDGLSL